MLYSSLKNPTEQLEIYSNGQFYTILRIKNSHQKLSEATK